MIIFFIFLQIFYIIILPIFILFFKIKKNILIFYLKNYLKINFFINFFNFLIFLIIFYFAFCLKAVDFNLLDKNKIYNIIINIEYNTLKESLCFTRIYCIMFWASL